MLFAVLRRLFFGIVNDLNASTIKDPKGFTVILLTTPNGYYRLRNANKCAYGVKAHAES